MDLEKTFITPDDWGLIDYERVTIQGEGDDWFSISQDGEYQISLHRDEIAILCKIVLGTEVENGRID